MESKKNITNIEITLDVSFKKLSKAKTKLKKLI
jgi:hypothetical protein